MINVGYSNARQDAATVKRPIADTRHTIRYDNTRQTATAGECTLLNIRLTVWYSVTVFLCLPINTLYYS